MPGDRALDLIARWQVANGASVEAFKAWDEACRHPERVGAIEAKFTLQLAIQAVYAIEQEMAAFCPEVPHA